MRGLKTLVAAAVLCTATSVAPLAAATVNVTTQGTNAFRDASGQNAWFESSRFSLNGTSRSAAAGLFRLTATGSGGVMQNFLAFCLEPLETLTLPKDHTVGTTLGASILNRLGTLMSNAFGLVNGSSSAAAFQMAVWEIANESSSSLDLGSGAFMMTQANAATKSLAQSWLDNINSGAWTSSRKVTVLSAPGTQDLLTDIAPVPLPAAGVLLLGGLAAMGAVRRRRK